MKPTLEDVIKLAKQYILERGMKYKDALARAKKELGYKGSD